MKYTLDDFIKIKSEGINITLSEDIINKINKICLEVGSPNYNRVPVFNNQPSHKNINNGNKQNTKSYKKPLAVFKSKLLLKSEFEQQYALLKGFLNKLTDKNYLVIHEDIVKQMDIIILSLQSQTFSEEEKENYNEDELKILKEQETQKEENLNKLGNNIFEICSTNRFYSRVYAELYADLLTKYNLLDTVFKKSYDTYISLFEKIECGDPNTDYDKFCECNLINEKRKSVSTFFINLMNNKKLTHPQIMVLIHRLLLQFHEHLNDINKRSEIDELTENLSILLIKDLKKYYSNTRVACLVDDKTIYQYLAFLANSKLTDFKEKGLGSKSLFKFKDIYAMLNKV